MSAVVGQDWRPKTLRELFIQYQAVLIETWHHTAHLKMMQVDTKKVKYDQLHPYFKLKGALKGMKLENKVLFPIEK